MTTTLKNIIAEVRTELVQYESAGMLDEISLRNWARRALKGFGNLVTTLQEKTVEVKNSRVKLPEDFYSLYAAAKCEPYKIEMIKGDETELIDSLFDATELFSILYGCDELFVLLGFILLALLEFCEDDLLDFLGGFKQSILYAS